MISFVIKSKRFFCMRTEKYLISSRPTICKKTIWSKHVFWCVIQFCQTNLENNSDLENNTIQIDLAIWQAFLSLLTIMDTHHSTRDLNGLESCDPPIYAYQYRRHNGVDIFHTHVSLFTVHNTQYTVHNSLSLRSESFPPDPVACYLS